MEVYERNLHIDDEAFEGMRMDADRVLQKLIKNMVEKGALEGSLTIKVDVLFQQEYIPNYDPEIEGESRKVLMPSFSHKVGSVMQIKDEAKGGSKYDGFELIWDDEAGEFVMKPITNTAQRNIFDVDFRCVNDEGGGSEEGEERFLEGRCVAALPGPSDTEGEEPKETIDAEDIKEEVEDITDEIIDAEFGIVDDGYSYEEPEDE